MKRLGKQRVEAKQILNALNPENNSKWKNHPAVVMWKGYEGCLKIYTNSMIEEWIRRGYKNTMEFYKLDGNFKSPRWLGDERIHSSHRAMLLQKDKKFYSQYNWKEEIEHPEAPYFWPVPLKNEQMYRKMIEYWEL